MAREDLVERLPEPHRPVADGDFRRDGKATGFDVDEQLAPALRALTHTDLKADDLLLSFGRRPENDENTLGLRLHPGLEVDAVRPDVDIPPRREVTALPTVIVLLPPLGQARDHTRRQVRRICTQDRRERLPEVAGGNAAQVEHRQQGIEAARPPRPFRQDGGAEPHLLVSRPGRAVTHLRAAHIKRADPGLDAPLRTIPMPDDTLPAIRQDLFGMLRDKGFSLCPKCSGQHPARPVPGNLGQRIVNRFRLTQGDDVGIFRHRRIVPSGSSGRLGHPPRYAAFSNTVTHFPA